MNHSSLSLPKIILFNKMSPRIKVFRKILNPPIIKGFKPYGKDSEKQKLEFVNMLYEEYEALRLSDYDGLKHLQASAIMGVSRPTFTRIYASALQKIAKAFVEGKQITIEGGKIYFDSEWFHCSECQCYFNNPEKETKIKACPLCDSSQFDIYDIENEKRKRKPNTADSCICPSCGFEIEHQQGIPCNKHECPKCGSLMKRKGNSQSKQTKP